LHKLDLLLKAIFFGAAEQSFSALGAIGDFRFYFNLLGGQIESGRFFSLFYRFILFPVTGLVTILSPGFAFYGLAIFVELGRFFLWITIAGRRVGRIFGIFFGLSTFSLSLEFSSLKVLSWFLRVLMTMRWTLNRLNNFRISARRTWINETLASRL
jgi:hypothetical protein